MLYRDMTNKQLVQAYHDTRAALYNRGVLAGHTATRGTRKRVARSYGRLDRDHNIIVAVLAKRGINPLR